VVGTSLIVFDFRGILRRGFLVVTQAFEEAWLAVESPVLTTTCAMQSECGWRALCWISGAPAGTLNATLWFGGCLNC
jgi:hypothetical protein